MLFEYLLKTEFSKLSQFGINEHWYHNGIVLKISIEKRHYLLGIMEECNEIDTFSGQSVWPINDFVLSLP